MLPGFSASQVIGPAAIALAGNIERQVLEQAKQRRSRLISWRDVADDLGAVYRTDASRRDLPLGDGAPDGLLTLESRDDSIPALLTVIDGAVRIDAFDLVHTIPFDDDSWRRCSHTIVLVTDPEALFPACRRRYIGRERTCESVRPGVMQAGERHRFEWTCDPACERAVEAIRDECTDRIGFANIDACGHAMLFYEVDTLLAPSRLPELIEGCRTVQERLKREMGRKER